MNKKRKSYLKKKPYSLKRLAQFQLTNVKPLSEVGEDNLLKYLDMSFKFDWRLRKKSIEKLSIIDDDRARNRIRELTLDEATLVRMYAYQYCKLLKILSKNSQPVELLKMQSLSFLKEMKLFKGSLLKTSYYLISKGTTPTLEEFIKTFREQYPSLYDLIDGRCISPYKTISEFKIKCNLAKIKLSANNQ